MPQAAEIFRFQDRAGSNPRSLLLAPDTSGRAGPCLSGLAQVQTPGHVRLGIPTLTFYRGRGQSFERCWDLLKATQQINGRAEARTLVPTW